MHTPRKKVKTNHEPRITMIKYAIAFVVGCFLAAIVFYKRHSSVSVPQPTVAQWQTALSNNAAAYFKAGVACGVTVERLRQNEKPGIVHANARAYFSTLGPDPYLSPAEGKQTKLDRALSQTKSETVTNAIVTATNSVSKPSTTNQTTP